MFFLAWLTQGGARSSLTLGYLLEPLTGFSVGGHCVRGDVREREARGVGRATARRSGATAERSNYWVFERSELMLTLPAKMGEGGRVGALSGAERAPLPPPFSAKR